MNDNITMLNTKSLKSDIDSYFSKNNIKFTRDLKIINISKIWSQDNRRAGNTTRIVDMAIQLLFSGYCIYVNDHVDNIHTRDYLYARTA